MEMIIVTIALEKKRNLFCDINLTKELKDIDNENFKKMKREIGEVTRHLKYLCGDDNLEAAFSVGPVIVLGVSMQATWEEERDHQFALGSRWLHAFP